MTVEFSVVIPMRNEAANAAQVVRDVCAALHGRAFEVICIDDGSDDGTGDVLLSLGVPELRVLRHAVPGGQSAGVHSGVRAARGALVATLDGDGQNPPSHLPAIFAELGAPGVGLVAGQRVGRRDSRSKRWASVAANAIRRAALKDGTRDTGCGLKAFRREDFLALPYFDHMHRYLPALFAAQGHRIALLDVTHAERAGGASNYTNLGRALAGAYDLIGVAWLIRRRKKVRPEELSGGAQDG
ncbi:MAG: glycosyltransferase family 2 protein [Shimia sp.]